MSTEGTEEVKKTRKKAEFKRTGPPCNPENAPGGCGRPLSVSDVPKTQDEIAKLQARKDKLDKRLAKAMGVKVVTVEQAAADKAATEKAEAEAKLARKLAREAKAAGTVTP